MHRPRSRPRSCRVAVRRGFVLPIALAVLILLTLAVYLLMDRTVNARITSENLVERKRIELAARSAGDVLLSMVADDPAFDPALMESWTIPLVSPSADEGSAATIEVTFLTPSPIDGGLIPGIGSENGKLNINTLAEADLDEQAANDLLVYATGSRIDAATADLILDMIDDDADPRPQGDESGLAGVPPRNQPLDTLEDLLVVPGITIDLLYGEDANRNNLLDRSEDDGSITMPPDNEDGLLEPGLASMLTVSSRESNLTLEGLPRVNLNGDDLTQIEADLSQYAFTEDQLAYLLTARKTGVDTGQLGGDADGLDGGGFGGEQGGGGGDQGGGSQNGGPVEGRQGGMFSVDASEASSLQDDGFGGGFGGGGFGGSGNGSGDSAQTRLTSLGDLLFPLNDESGTPSPFAEDPDALRLLFDVAALSDEPTVSGRIDLRAASADLLSGLPNWDAGLADSVISQSAGWTSVADLYSNGLVDPAGFRTVEPLLTVGSRTYRFQAIAFVRGGPAVRYEFVVDAADPAEPRLQMMQDLTPLSLGVDRAVFETPAE